MLYLANSLEFEFQHSVTAAKRASEPKRHGIRKTKPPHVEERILCRAWNKIDMFPVMGPIRHLRRETSNIGTQGTKRKYVGENGSSFSCLNICESMLLENLSPMQTIFEKD